MQKQASLMNYFFALGVLEMKIKAMTVSTYNSAESE